MSKLLRSDESYQGCIAIAKAVRSSPFLTGAIAFRNAILGLTSSCWPPSVRPMRNRAGRPRGAF